MEITRVCRRAIVVKQLSFHPLQTPIADRHSKESGPVWPGVELLRLGIWQELTEPERRLNFLKGQLLAGKCVVLSFSSSFIQTQQCQLHHGMQEVAFAFATCGEIYCTLKVCNTLLQVKKIWKRLLAASPILHFWSLYRETSVLFLIRKASFQANF